MSNLTFCRTVETVGQYYLSGFSKYIIVSLILEKKKDDKSSVKGDFKKFNEIIIDKNSAFSDSDTSLIT